MATKKKKAQGKKKLSQARTKKRASKKRSSKKIASRRSHRVSEDMTKYCSLPHVPLRSLDHVVDPNRRELIRVREKFWVAGTQLHYYFFDQSEDAEVVTFSNGTTQRVSWVGPEEQKAIVRAAFDLWKNVGIGLEFIEVDNRHDAEIRIGFMDGDGSWSYIGKDVLRQGANKRTMNFGWDLRGQPDTAIHEIGHTLGFPHEHQNPNAGIVWNEPKVIAELLRTNGWDEETTFRNIIRKIVPDTVQGSNWDANSVMHYPFAPGLILEPEEFGRTGIQPTPGLSERDKRWVKTFYPPSPNKQLRTLLPFESQEMLIGEGEQESFIISPDASREYQLQTFGTSDVVMVLFEDDGGELRFIAGDDDSGDDRNAHMQIRLLSGRRYVLRIRLYWADETGRSAVMMW